MQAHQIRAALPQEANLLTALAIRSKAHRTQQVTLTKGHQPGVSNAINR